MSEREILDSWKEIASHLKRSRRTCQKWEKELGLPIHRLDDTPKARVFAYKDELDRWLEEILKQKKEPAGEMKWRNSIAVLPFVDLSAYRDQEYFCDGMVEELINSLTRIKDLRVVARTSAFFFRGKNVDIEEIGKKLKVDRVLEGSVRKAGKKLRVTAQLINVADGYHIWSGRYDREFEDVFAIQDDIAQSIINALEIEVLGKKEAPLVMARTENPEAYEAYLKGRYHLYKFTQEQVDTAFEYFQLALEKEPNYALALAGIAQIWIVRGNLGFAPIRESFQKAKTVVLKAIELDDTLAEAHFCLAGIRFYFEWDWERAETEFQRGIELKPNYVHARLMYAELLILMRRPDEAMAEIERCLELDPLNYFPQQMYGGHLLQLRRYDDAIAQFRKIIRIEPDLPAAHEGLWIAFYQKRMYDDALAEAKRYFEVLGNREVADALALGYAKASYSGAMRLAAEKLAERLKQNYVPAIRIALLYAHAGEKDRALDWLERAYEEHEPFMVYLSVDLQWDKLREDPRFQALLRRMNFPS